MNHLDFWSALFRGCHTAALISAFGTMVFAHGVVGPRSTSPGLAMACRRLARLSAGSVLAAVILGVAWLAVRAASIADAQGPADTLAALPVVAFHTQFGRVLLLRLILLALLLGLSEAAWRPFRSLVPVAAVGSTGSGLVRPRVMNYGVMKLSIALATAALGLQGGASHAGAIEGAAGRNLLTAEALHVIAVGAWLGSLLPLLIVLASVGAEHARAVLRRYVALGAIAVFIIAATSVAQAYYLVGSIPALLGTTYGRLALLKSGLLAGLLVCAALNRFVLGTRPAAGLRRSIATEAGIGAVVILAAAILAHCTPAAHEQPVWPFAWRLNPLGTGERLVRAYPTSYFVSPTGFTVEAIVHGEQTYQANCASCHGTRGRGDGTASGTLPARPPDLTDRRILEINDGDLFWFAGHAGQATDNDRWELVDYLRALNRGEFARTAGRAMPPTRIPRFSTYCTNGTTVVSDDMRGQVVRIVMPSMIPGRTMQPDAEPTIQTFDLNVATPPRSEAPSCVATSDTWRAIAILLGTTREALAGGELLIDPNGWMRARWQPGQPGGWPTHDRLMARARLLSVNPLPADPSASHSHQH